nr:ORF3 [Torque teno felis virus]
MAFRNNLYGFNTSYISRSQELPYGQRCRATSSLMAWYLNHLERSPQKCNLKPEKLIRKDLGPKANMISGPEISTPTGSSKTELIRELLQLIQEMSDARWKSEDDLNISLKSLSESSMTETSSSDDEWENIPDTPPNPPCKGGGLNMCHFQKKMAIWEMIK